MGLLLLSELLGPAGKVVVIFDGGPILEREFRGPVLPAQATERVVVKMR